MASTEKKISKEDISNEEGNEKEEKKSNNKDLLENNSEKSCSGIQKTIRLLNLFSNSEKKRKIDISTEECTDKILEKQNTLSSKDKDQNSFNYMNNEYMIEKGNVKLCEDQREGTHTRMSHLGNEGSYNKTVSTFEKNETNDEKKNDIKMNDIKNGDIKNNDINNDDIKNGDIKNNDRISLYGKSKKGEEKNRYSKEKTSIHVHAEVEKKDNIKHFFDYTKYRNKCNVTFSMKYKDSSVSLSNDKLTCYGDKGWSSVFVNNGADIGKWYYEIKIEEPVQNFNFLGYKDKIIKVNPYIRVGFACRYMRYDYPIGTDKYSYCVNSKNGKIFNNSISYDCMEPFNVGDIIGCYLNLKNKNSYNFDPRLDKKLYEHLQNGILCDPKNPPLLKKNEGSTIFFSLNGQIKKTSFMDIYEGFYHPSVSLYMGASAKINLGPNFTYNHLQDYVPCVYMEPPIVL
ncbi:SPRY domain, putative [Plasmodium sp. gorilla clade G2]|uniref:SPRY domain, putative n=1 Tax=Plasmodium sp. gorilla clade G2 TaxID=880535 RepID=UPI000D2252FD|nr:SPRY domain, putative [Plasmodium sp. gorilla clade G2]SOV13810.1 SPRY domain, putative [Plasmodium sp. gorilla clade G2]